MEKDIRIGTLVQVKEHVDDYLRQIIPYGFESFSFTFGGGFDWKTPAELADIVMPVINASDAVCSTISLYQPNTLDEGEEGDKARRQWETLIDSAELFGTKVVTGFTGRLKDVPIDKNIERFKAVWPPLAERAAAKGVKIGFENCNMGGTWDKGTYNIAQNPAAWELMFEAVPAENFGLEWEPCHQMVQLIDPMPQLREWGKRFVHIHGKDATIHRDILAKYGFRGAKPWCFHRTPGFGECNWTEIISELRRIGFKGSIDIEGWHDPVYRGELEMTGQVNGLQYLKRCRGDYYANPV